MYICFITFLKDWRRKHGWAIWNVFLTHSLRIGPVTQRCTAQSRPKPVNSGLPWSRRWCSRWCSRWDVNELMSIYCWDVTGREENSERKSDAVKSFEQLNILARGQPLGGTTRSTSFSYVFCTGFRRGLLCDRALYQNTLILCAWWCFSENFSRNTHVLPNVIVWLHLKTNFKISAILLT